MRKALLSGPQELCNGAIGMLHLHKLTLDSAEAQRHSGTAQRGIRGIRGIGLFGAFQSLCQLLQLLLKNGSRNGKMTRK